ncbi:MAG: hypothetical protein LBH72_05340, partial [Proteiniphilum sp.]|nr:hypothetical protein [Proteiniphilum sp.]
LPGGNFPTSNFYLLTSGTRYMRGMNIAKRSEQTAGKENFSEGLFYISLFLVSLPRALTTSFSGNPVHETESITY